MDNSPRVGRSYKPKGEKTASEDDYPSVATVWNGFVSQARLGNDGIGCRVEIVSLGCLVVDLGAVVGDIKRLKGDGLGRC